MGGAQHGKGDFVMYTLELAALEAFAREACSGPPVARPASSSAAEGGDEAVARPGHPGVLGRVILEVVPLEGDPPAEPPCAPPPENW